MDCRMAVRIDGECLDIAAGRKAGEAEVMRERVLVGEYVVQGGEKERAESVVVQGRAPAMKGCFVSTRDDSSSSAPCSADWVAGCGAVQCCFVDAVDWG